MFMYNALHSFECAYTTNFYLRRCCIQRTLRYTQVFKLDEIYTKYNTTFTKFANSKNKNSTNYKIRPILDLHVNKKLKDFYIL